jgi:polyhydroxyalkanoate synthesis regulator phasin
VRSELSARGMGAPRHIQAPRNRKLPHMPNQEPETRPGGDDSGVADALRGAIERTLAATGPAAGQTRERAGEIVEEISKRGQDAREELARRGQGAGAEIARLGQEAREALSKRGAEATSELRSQLDALEKRLASVEDRLKAAQASSTGQTAPEAAEAKPKAEG